MHKNRKIQFLVSLDTAFLRNKRPDWMGKCILCVLIHAIFIFGIFIAFLIGHWISEGNKDGNSVSFIIKKIFELANKFTNNTNFQDTNKN